MKINDALSEGCFRRSKGDEREREERKRVFRQWYLLRKPRFIVRGEDSAEEKRARGFPLSVIGIKMYVCGQEYKYS